jgi:plasmid stabilization system protein ParE
MSLPVVVRFSAETDLLESALFIAEDDPLAAQRLLDEAEKGFAQLAEFPEIGSPRTTSDPSLAGLRLWPDPGFEKFRICYIPRSDRCAARAAWSPRL